jgi:hypothetical protein
LKLQVHSRAPDNPFHGSFVLPSAVSKIPALRPARRFCFLGLSADAELASWFHSGALHNLQELAISYDKKSLPPFALFSPSKICDCNFPHDIMSSVSFPLLNKLSLFNVAISEQVFHKKLSVCHALESLSI